MKAITLRRAAGLEHLERADLADPGAPAPGEIRVCIHAMLTQLPWLECRHGRLLADDGRIPISDGAGVVEAIGDDVTEFPVGDGVVSAFFPYWIDGGPTLADFSTTPGDGVDGYVREIVVRPAQWFTHAPRATATRRLRRCRPDRVACARRRRCAESRWTPCSFRARVASRSSHCSSRSGWVRL
jgi:NADPH:quinone reductase-like Zn-dependent oxidoreductase